MLHTPGLFALFVAKLLSTFGSWLTLLALPWFVLVTTGSPVKMSTVLAAEFLGVATLGLPRGKVVARLGVRRTMLICDAARVPLMALIPLLHQKGWLSLPALLAVSFSLGAFTAPYVSSQRLILADLLGPARGTDEKLLARANSLIDSATRVAALAGPAISGLLIALLGPAQVLWIDAGTYLVSFVILSAFVRPPATAVAGADRESSPASDEQAATFAGLRHALRHRALRLFVLALTFVAISVPAVFICLPVLVMDDLGGDPRTLGLLTAANGAGLAIGSLVAVTGLSRMNNTVLTGGAMLQCAPLWLLLVDQTFAVASGLFLIGLATPLQLSGVRTVFAVIATLAALGAITFAMALRADHPLPATSSQRPREPRQHRRTSAWWTWSVIPSAVWWRRPVRQQLGRSPERSWRLHRQLAMHLTPESLREWRPVMLRNPRRLRDSTRGQPHLRNLDRWQRLIEDDDLSGLRRVMIGLDVDSVQMREVSPMGGLLPQYERAEVLRRAS